MGLRENSPRGMRPPPAVVPSLGAMATSSPAAGPLPEVARFIASEHRMFVGGEWTAARGGATFEVHDPASGAVVAHVPLASAEDVDDAVAAARAAQPVWAGLSPAQRATMLWNLGQRIEDEAEVFAQIDSIDNGKPVWEARAVDVPLTAGIFRFYAGLVQTIAGSVLPVSLEGFHAYSRREPVGVVGAIVPWNFPLLMCGYKLGPALAAGNAVVIKPAEQTPLSALRLAALIEEVRLPARRRQRRHRLRRDHRRPARRAPGHRQDQLHRLQRGRPPHRRRRRGRAQEDDPRARRQVAEHHLRRRRPGRRRRGRPRGRLLQPGPVLRRRQPPAGGAHGRRRGARAPARQRHGDPAGPRARSRDADGPAGERGAARPGRGIRGSRGVGRRDAGRGRRRRRGRRGARRAGSSPPPS